MKTTIAALVLVLLPTLVIAEPCPDRLACPDGTTLHKSEFQLWCSKGEIPHGPQVQCDRNGKLIEVNNYALGSRHGRHVRYTSTGKLLVEETFVQGHVDGLAKSWHPGGRQLSSEIEMHRGEPHGRTRRWHANGVLAKEAMYEDGKLQGRLQTWHPSGAREVIANYKDGLQHGEQHRFHPNNWIYEVAHFDSGKLTRDYVRFTDDGKVEVKGQYDEGLKVGEWFDDFGRGPARGRYKAGKKVGEWRFFGRIDGELLGVEHYRDDLLHGPYEQYQAGRLEETGSHVDNLRDGVWKKFGAKGELVAQDTWDEGMLLEQCEPKQRKLVCEKRTPYRLLSVQCGTDIPAARFINSAADFQKHFTCPRQPPIRWDEHRVYVHRDEADSYAVRFSDVEVDGGAYVLVFKQYQVCYGMDPRPHAPRWITLVVPRGVENVRQRIEQMPATKDCTEVP